MSKVFQEETLVYSLDSMDHVINKLYGFKEESKIYAFSGPLGAGKTTCVKSLLSNFDIHTPVTSPTFSYVNVYENGKGSLIYHFDLYRLKDIHEFMEAGFNELLYLENSWVLVEWPELILPLITHNACLVTIDYSLKADERQMNYSLIL
jgi:tRNA threonylcarbamoyladenosine biosynthesis protein TsaE